MKNEAKTQEIKCIELYVSPMKERNIDKYGYDSEQCECCGKIIKSTDSKIVHMGTDWLAYNTIETELINGVEYIIGTDVETQGFFKIGNDCAKKMKGFTFNI
jgi:hypothetical protein